MKILGNNTLINKIGDQIRNKIRNPIRDQTMFRIRI